MILERLFLNMQFLAPPLFRSCEYIYGTFKQVFYIRDTKRYFSVYDICPGNWDAMLCFFGTLVAVIHSRSRQSYN